MHQLHAMKNYCLLVVFVVYLDTLFLNCTHLFSCALLGFNLGCLELWIMEFHILVCDLPREMKMQTHDKDDDGVLVK